LSSWRWEGISGHSLFPRREGEKTKSIHLILSAVLLSAAASFIERQQLDQLRTKQQLNRLEQQQQFNQLL
jgi:hypothetical protein